MLPANTDLLLLLTRVVSWARLFTGAYRPFTRKLVCFSTCNRQARFLIDAITPQMNAEFSCSATLYHSRDLTT